MPARSEKVLSSLKSHKKALTADGDKFLGDPEILERVMDKVIGLVKPIESDDCIRTGSVRATLQSGVSSFGQFGFLREKLDVCARISYSEVFFLERVIFKGRTFQRCPTWERKLLTVYVPCWADLEWVANEFPPCPDDIRDWMFCEDVLKNFTEFQEDYLTVRPAAILEPLKVRMVSLPCSGAYFSLTPIQKQMHRRLKKVPIFRLIGRPLEVGDVNELLADGICSLICKPDDFGFASGDFSAATDNLKSFLTKGLYTRWCRALAHQHPDIYQWGLNSLTNSMVRWDEATFPSDDPFFQGSGGKRYKEGLEQLRPEKGVQTNGQLMGHVLSFPILCLANLTAFWYAIDTYLGVDLHKGDLPPVLVNGDDILFMSSPGFYKHWCETVPLFGLIPSLGKNLFSPSIAQINSELFQIQNIRTEYGKNLPISVRKIEYLNFGLLTGRGKGKGMDDWSMLESEFKYFRKDSHKARFNPDPNYDPLIARLESLPIAWKDLKNAALMVRADPVLVENQFRKHLKIFSRCLPKFPTESVFNDSVDLALYIRSLKQELYEGGEGIGDCLLSSMLRQKAQRKNVIGKLRDAGQAFQRSLRKYNRSLELYERSFRGIERDNFARVVEPIYSESFNFPLNIVSTLPEEPIQGPLPSLLMLDERIDLSYPDLGCQGSGKVSVLIPSVVRPTYR
jgi:hypothetical protein